MKLIFYDGSIIGKRNEQQDDKTNLKLTDGYHLCVIADGMGGHTGGQIASKAACVAFRRFFYQNPEISDPEAALREALAAANQALSEVVKQNPALEGLGSTLVALLIQETTGKFNFISVGDSPLYRFGQGLLQRLNDNHSFYEDLKLKVVAGLISAQEAENHPHRHVITSALTGQDIPKIDRKSGLLGPGELILMATDGLQTLDDGVNGKIADILKQADSLETAIKLLLKNVERTGGPHQDNATVILLGLENDPPITEPRSAAKTGASTDSPPTLALGQAGKGPAGKVIILLSLIIAGLILFMIWKKFAENQISSTVRPPSQVSAPPEERKSAALKAAFNVLQFNSYKIR